MEIRYPVYYQDFRCLAGVCPDSCCKQWAVVVDDTSACRYRALPGELGDALRRSLQTEDGDTILALNADGRCPMWRSDGLCRIQVALGEEGLCDTCRQFPRLRHDYGDFVELGLELSCPEAARLILADCGSEDICQTQAGGEAPEYDAQAMDVLLRSRGEILEFLKDETVSIADALSILLVYGYRVQEELDGGSEAILEPARLLAVAKELAVPSAHTELTDFFATLEILTPDWRTRLQHPRPGPWAQAHRAMARYFVKRYWLQAVSDYDLVGRIKLTVISCLMVKLLGGDVLETAQHYSKEIENDQENVAALLDAAYTEPAFADIRLLGFLREE